jgi:ribosomal protein S18 acetylase RimI-like enzyme
MWAVRRATEADASELAALAERVFRETFGPDNTAEDMDLYAASAFTVERQLAALRDPNIVVLLVEADGRHAAFATLRLDAAASALEIQRFYVDAPWHGRGMAQALMVSVVELAATERAQRIWLGVWERNARGIAFYEKCGFRVVGEQAFMLGRDQQRDLVMAREPRSVG